MRLRPRERVLVQSAAGTLVLLDLDGGEYYALDDVSARVWELCDGERDVEGVVAAVIAEYEAPPERIRADVLELVDELRAEGLLTVD